MTLQWKHRLEPDLTKPLPKLGWPSLRAQQKVFIYIIGYEDEPMHDVYKVGSTGAPLRRLEQFQHASPWDLAVFALWEKCYREMAEAVEREVAALAEDNDIKRRGEWYHAPIGTVVGLVACAHRIQLGKMQAPEKWSSKYRLPLDLGAAGKKRHDDA